MAAKGEGKIRILYFWQAAQIIRSLDLIRVNKYVSNAYYTLANVLGTRNTAEDKTENPKFMDLQWEVSGNKYNK